MKFTNETSSYTVVFQDLNVSLRNGAIHTDINIKPTDSHQYLHYQSSHPLYIKISIQYSQVLRVNRFCSSKKDFKTHVSQMKEWFLVRGYPEIVVSNQIALGRDQLRKIWKVAFLLLLPITLRLKSFENSLGTCFLFKK